MQLDNAPVNPESSVGFACIELGGTEGRLWFSVEEKRRFVLEPWPRGNAESMRFRLVLRGHLPPDRRGTGDVKQRIRRELHPQLRRLWEQHPALKRALLDPLGGKLPIDMIGDEYNRCGFRFVPLIRAENQMACSLEFLILRREEPHRLFSGSGDLDGRVKTLIDGLRMPQQCSEVDGQLPGADENPFFCLLEDDKLIFNFSVVTDRLLVPPEPLEPERDVVAVIGVEIKTTEGSELATFSSGFYPGS